MTGNEKLALVDHYVKVESAEGNHSEGLVYTVDPVTASLVLYSKGKVFVVNGYYIKSILVTANPTKELNSEQLESVIFKKKKVAEVSSRKKRDTVMKWLQKYRFPVTLDGDNICVGDDVCMITSPYDESSCLSTNSVVLQRIQDTLREMTADD